MNGPSPHQAAAAAWNHGFVSIRMDPATPASLLTSQPASFLFSLFPSSPWTPNGPPSLWADPLYVSFLNWDDQIFICWGTESPFLSSDWVPVDEVCWSAHCSLGSHSRLGVTPVWDPRRHTAQSRMQMVPPGVLQGTACVAQPLEHMEPGASSRKASSLLLLNGVQGSALSTASGTLSEMRKLRP